jgi:hypothetical protein
MEMRLDRLVGRTVKTANHRRLGRIEAIRAEKHGNGCVVTAYVVGRVGLAERLGAGVRLLVGRRGRASGYVVQWDQLDISNIECPRLLCPVEQLVRE